MYIKTFEVIFQLNSTSMKKSKLFEASINVQAGTIAHYERIYFIDKDSQARKKLILLKQGKI